MLSWNHEVKGYDCNPVFRKREDCLHIAFSWCLKMYKIFVVQKAVSIDQKEETAFCKLISFFLGDESQPLLYAIVTGSEDGTENVPSASAFRPDICIPFKC